MSIDQETLASHAADLLSLEKHVLNAVRQQSGSSASDHEAANKLLVRTQTKLSDHVGHLEKHVESIGGDLKAEIKQNVASFAGVVAGLIDRARQDPLSKILRDNYTALGMLASGYTMLYTTATAAENSELAELANEHLRDITQLVTETSKVLPIAVAHELTDDAEQAEEIGRKAYEDTQSAWDAEHVHGGADLVEA